MLYLESLSSARLCHLFFKSLDDCSLDKNAIEQIAKLWEYPSSLYSVKEFELKLKQIALPNDISLKVKLLGELFRRQFAKKNLNEIKLQTPQQLYERFKFINYSSTESLYLICVDSQYRMLEAKEVARGNEFQMSIHSPSILREAIKCTTFGFFLIHNHPSGECRPSENDLLFTKKINQASQVIGLKFVDHLILGDGFYSFKEHQLL